MARTLFGTDGIRGKVNSHPMTVEVAVALGRALAAQVGPGVAVVGKDTRNSCDMVGSALVAGLMSGGVDVVDVGIIPTPGVAHVVKRLRAALGLVISASHNPFFDNGIKVFGPDGFKLSDAQELELEAGCLVEEGVVVNPERVGRARREAGAELYLQALDHAAGDLDLEGMRIAVDCAHGATYEIAPRLLRGLGAELTLLGARPTGKNINHEVGATHPEAAAQLVASGEAQFGVTFDGDGDRVIFVDEDGVVVDGDEVLAMMALAYHRSGQLTGGSIAATVMSNIGLDAALREHGIGVVRTDVGDRYVVEAMRRDGLVVGGEQSGHIICLDQSTTGDGILAAVTVLSEMRATGSSLKELRQVMTAFPQAKRNLMVRAKPPMNDLTEVQSAIAGVESDLGDEGRVLVRYSGTEPKARVLVEGRDEAVVSSAADHIAQAIHDAIGVDG